MKIKTIVESTVNPSESPIKVLNAIKNISGVPGRCIIDEKNKLCKSETYDLSGLSLISEKIKSRQIAGVVRRLLIQNISRNSTWILFNKQAAFVGSINVCEDENDSNLGPIKCIIESNDLMKIIEWLAPL
jgi:predicted RNA binding protein with dsRBD fold (UPF0201 family)